MKRFVKTPMTDPVHEAYDNARKTHRRDYEVTAVFHVEARNWEHAIELAMDDPRAGDWDAN